MNESLLRATMVLKNVKVSEICEELGISRSAWFRKLNGSSDFTRDEISVISKVLYLDEAQLIQIFFASEVT